MTVEKCALLFFLVASMVNGEYINPYYGPFDIVFHKIEKCEGPLAESKLFNLNPLHLIRDRHIPKGWWYNGTLSLSEGFNNKIFMDIKFASWKSRGGWAENAYMFNMDKICDKMKMWVPESWVKNLTAAAGHPEQKSICPIPKGEYTIRNFYFNLDISKYLPPLPYGKFRLDFKYAKERKSPFEGCLKLYADLVPKPGGTSASWSLQDFGIMGG